MYSMWLNRSQEHILDIAVLDGTVSEKLKVARRFKENFDILENMKK